MKKIIIFIVLAIISLFIYLTYNNKEKVYEPIKDYETFPPKEYLDKLEEMKVQ